MIPQLPDETLAQLVSNVTNTMLGMRARLAPGATPQDEYTVLLPINSPMPVVIALSSSVSGLRLLSAAMFRCKPDELDGQMLQDALGELVNMAAGQIKAALAMDHALGLPEHVKAVDTRLSAGRFVSLRAGDAPLGLRIIVSSKS